MSNMNQVSLYTRPKMSVLLYDFDRMAVDCMIKLRLSFICFYCSWADPEGWGTGGPDPLKTHKNIGFLCNTGPDPLKNHKATKTAVDDGSFIAVFVSSIPLSSKNEKKKLSALDPLWKKLSRSAYDVAIPFKCMC